MTELGLTCRTFCRKLAAGEDEAATVELVLDAVLWEICRELECKPNDTRLRLLDNTATLLLLSIVGRTVYWDAPGRNRKRLYYGLFLSAGSKYRLLRHLSKNIYPRQPTGDKCFP